MIPRPVKNIRRMDKGSAYTGKLPKGCVLCEKGAKLVLLVSGRCSSHCCYCPLSKEKRGKDVFFANERRISRAAEAIEEAELMDALGTGITGGDPLEAMQRTVASIRALKKSFGDDHHIHLYTASPDVNRVERLASAGLDEIRFHPPVESWSRLELTSFPEAFRAARRSGMDVGMEVPVLPDKKAELDSVIVCAAESDLDFVNLNELEFSETNWRALRRLGYDVKNDISSGVAGSERLAQRLLRQGAAIPLHYCSSSFKDAIQLRRRIARRARNVIKPHELLTRDGTFLKGVIETRAPAKVAEMLRDKFDVPGRLLWVDKEKNRLEVAPWVLEDLAPELKLRCYIVEEYPTADRLEVEREPLTRR